MLKKTEVTKVAERKGFYLIWTKNSSVPKIYRKSHNIEKFLLSL